MKSPMEVLRMKENQILILRKEIDALRVTARLLFDEGGLPTGATTTASGMEGKKQDLRQLMDIQ